MKDNLKFPIIVMGVAGAGKTTVGKLMAQRLKAVFLEGDDYHLSMSVDKVKRGIALKDADRMPWLKSLNQLLLKQIKQEKRVILACSALKHSYRQVLSANVLLSFVYLKIDKSTAIKRLKARKGHFFNSDLIDSQFEALQEPQDALTINSNNLIDQVLEEICQKVGE